MSDVTSGAHGGSLGGSDGPLDGAARGSKGDSTLRIGVIYPAVLGTYGDGGNAVVLAERARRRGFAAEIVEIGLGDPVPVELDIYTLGGGEDSAQAIAAGKLRASNALTEAARRGAPVLAICASLQVLGTEYTDARDKLVPGLGLLDVVTTPRGKRAIGELITSPLVEGLSEPLTGFENHGGGTVVGSDATPLGRVTHGVGNGAFSPQGPLPEERYEGAVQGSVIGTYMHGPALARNPELADFILRKVLGDLEALEVPGVERLRAERLKV